MRVQLAVPPNYIQPVHRYVWREFEVEPRVGDYVTLPAEPDDFARTYTVKFRVHMPSKEGEQILRLVLKESAGSSS